MSEEDAACVGYVEGFMPYWFTKRCMLNNLALISCANIHTVGRDTVSIL